MNLTELLNPQFLISTLGLLGVIAIIFLETGAFFGFFFPGDSLLITAGFFASQGHISITFLLIGTFIAAVVGDTVGYAFGKRVGPTIFNKEESVFFSRKHILRAQQFYEKHGRKTIILARFIPIIRTLAPIVAGVGNMKYRTFVIFNIVGGFLWTWSMLLVGYIFGSVIPDADRYIFPFVLVIVLISAAPGIIKLVSEYVKSLKSRK